MDFALDAVAVLVSVLLLAGLVAFATRRLLNRHGPETPSRGTRGPISRMVIVPFALSVVGFGLFAFIAEDVVSRQPTELMRRVDRTVQQGAQWMRGRAGVRVGAAILSHVMGEGLGILVPLGAAWLYTTDRRREAGVLVAGIVSAWALSGVLKLAFAVPRPHAGATRYAITGYGFPSGHTLVATVASGLVAWLAGRGLRSGTRGILWTGAVVLVALTAVARVILQAHWLSDVAGGLSVGVLWLGLIMLMVDRGPHAHTGGRSAQAG